MRPEICQVSHIFRIILPRSINLFLASHPQNQSINSMHLTISNQAVHSLCENVPCNALICTATATVINRIYLTCEVSCICMPSHISCYLVSHHVRPSLH